jgi:hypothetical protein
MEIPKPIVRSPNKLLPQMQIYNLTELKKNLEENNRVNKEMQNSIV